MDLIGPCRITTSTNRTYEFLALTCIDRVTGLSELIRLDNKESAHFADKFSECWLARYPHQSRVATTMVDNSLDGNFKN